jgi:lipopolysaccharide biosynthesis glycosyltransferase
MNSLKLSIESYEIQNDDYNYQHLPHQPILLDFLQDYKIENNSSSQKQDDMIDHLSLICHISAELGHFLMNVARYRNENPFRTGLIRLIREENDLCEDQNRNYMNLLLVDGLKSLMRNYEQRIQIIKSDPKQITLTDIYERIKYISEYPLVSEYVIDSCRTNITDDFLF